MLTVSSVLALAACGGDKTADQPKIERSLAQTLAVRSDNVAMLLDRGDQCGAKREAAGLRREVTEAINTRRVPDVYLEDLSGVVNEIEAQIVCRQAQLPPPPGEDDAGDDGKGEKKEKHKHKHKHEHGDDD